MSIYGIGVDLLAISRIQNLIEEYGDKFVRRILSDAERKVYQAKNDILKLAYLAKAYAAKEAVFKAMGTGLREGHSFQQIEILRDNLGKPTLHFNGVVDAFMKKNDITNPQISLSDEKEYVIAYVILEKNAAK